MRTGRLCRLQLCKGCQGSTVGRALGLCRGGTHRIVGASGIYQIDFCDLGVRKRQSNLCGGCIGCEQCLGYGLVVRAVRCQDLYAESIGAVERHRRASEILDGRDGLHGAEIHLPELCSSVSSCRGPYRVSRANGCGAIHHDGRGRVESSIRICESRARLCRLSLRQIGSVLIQHLNLGDADKSITLHGCRAHADIATRHTALCYGCCYRTGIHKCGPGRHYRRCICRLWRIPQSSIEPPHGCY